MFKKTLRCKSISGPIVIMIAILFMIGCSKRVTPMDGSVGLSKDQRNPAASSKSPSERLSSRQTPGKESAGQTLPNDNVTDKEIARSTPSEGLTSKSPRHDSQGIDPSHSTMPQGQEGGMSNGPGFMENIYFDYDQAIVRTDAKRTLEENSRWLALNSSIKVKIEGHGDERGTNDYNLALGERRARSIMRYLINLGINKSRFSFISYGEEKNVCVDQKESCYKKNRRVHFLVQK